MIAEHKRTEREIMVDSYIRHASFSSTVKRQSTHYHDCHQLILIKNGSIEITINGKVQSAQGGDIVIVSRFENHSIRILSSEYERYLLRISNSIPSNDRIFSIFINRPENFSNIISVAPFVKDFEDIMNKIISECGRNDRFSTRQQNLLINELMIDICRLLPEKLYNFNTTDFDLINSLQQEFESNYADDFSLKRLAEKYSVSVSTLSHSFKKITGVSAFEYLLSCRMTAAKTLLTKTNYPVSEIVERCGFTDSSNFSRSFKKMNGLSPVKFRKKYGHQSVAQ